LQFKKNDAFAAKNSDENPAGKVQFYGLSDIADQPV